MTRFLKFLIVILIFAGGAIFLIGQNVIGYQDWLMRSLPAPPSSGIGRIYVDSSTNLLNCILIGGTSCMPTGGAIIQTNGTNNFSQANLNFSNSGGCTWSNPSVGIEEVTCSGATPGGTSGQTQYNNSGVFGGYTMNTDCTIVTSTGVITCTKTNGTSFGALAIAGYPSSGVPDSTGSAWGTSYSVQGTDSHLLSSGTASSSQPLGCTDANGGFTTSGCGTGYTQTIASGTASLGTSAIASAACASAVTVSASGVATTDTLTASFNGDPSSTTGYIPSINGMLSILVYPTSGNVNFKVCNNTASSITPGSITLNWKVVR